MDTSEVTEIDVPYPEAGDRQLKITVGACRLKIKPGLGQAWVSGSYRDPSGTLPCKVVRDGGSVTITQTLERANPFKWPGNPPTFDLALGKEKPYTLTIETGASENIIDLGGIPISRCAIRQGAGKITIDFSAPNPQAMSQLSVSAGAGGLELANLSNANAAEMIVEGGAAAYKLDFGGTLQRDSNVRISTGMASVEIVVPATTAVKMTTETVLGSVDVGDHFMKREGAFWNEAALAGKTPLLGIRANVALGSLRLRLR